MRRHERPIIAFRRRLLRLIDDRFDGKYTVLAQRAGIPTSTMEHYVHLAKRLPGGEHLMRMAAALEVTLEDLLSGQEVGGPVTGPTPPELAGVPRGDTAPRGPATRVALPVFRCGCPGRCPLTEAVPPVAAAHARVVLAAAMVAQGQDHRLLAIEVDPRLPSAEWPLGAQLVVDWDDRTPRWAALMLVHTDGRCRLGHVTPSGDRLRVASRMEGTPDVMSHEGRVLGSIIAGVTSLSHDLT